MYHSFLLREHAVSTAQMDIGSKILYTAFLIIAKIKISIRLLKTKEKKMRKKYIFGVLTVYAPMEFPILYRLKTTILNLKLILKSAQEKTVMDIEEYKIRP